MKKTILSVALLIMMGAAQVAMAQSATPTKVERKGDTFVYTKQPRQKSEPILTPYFWEEKGVKHPIYMSSKSGSCFILTTKKDGTEGRRYLGKEISATICKEMGVEYKPKNSNK